MLKELNELEELFKAYYLPFNYTMKNDQYTINEILSFIETNRSDVELKRPRKHSNLTNEISFLDKLNAKLRHMSKSTCEIIVEHLKLLTELKPVVFGKLTH